jgi:hypothetical protein
MDTSVFSIEALAKEFGHSLFERGFSRGVLRTLKPQQCSGVLETEHAVIGLVLSGELLIELPECLLLNGVGDEFFLPPNIYFQATAGELGAQYLFAKRREIATVCSA